MPNYEDYLEHFFDNAEASIREGKGQELSDNLSHIAELIHELIDKEVDSKKTVPVELRFLQTTVHPAVRYSA